MTDAVKDIEPAENAVELVVYALEMAVAELHRVNADPDALKPHWETICDCYGSLSQLMGVIAKGSTHG